MLPLPATTVSLNVNTILAFTPTLVAPSVGDELETVGARASAPGVLYDGPFVRVPLLPLPLKSSLFSLNRQYPFKLADDV